MNDIQPKRCLANSRARRLEGPPEGGYEWTFLSGMIFKIKKNMQQVRKKGAGFQDH